MRVAFDGHQVGDLYGPHLGHPAQVVAPQVHQHHVLGPLFLAGAQLGLHPLVVLGVASAAASAGDGTVAQLAPCDGHQDFGRGAQHGELGQPQEVHVGRRIDRAQHAIDIEWVRRHRRLEALRHLHLVDVSRQDVRLGPLYRGKELLAGSMPDRIQGPAWWRRPQRTELHRLGEARLQGVQPLGSGPVGGLERTGTHVGDQLQAMLHVVETDQRVADQEHPVGYPQGVRVRKRDALQVAGGFVTEVANRAAAEAGQAVGRLGPKTGQVSLQRIQGIAPRQNLGARFVGEPRGAIPDRDDGHRVRRHEGVAAQPLPSLHALQQIGRSVRGQRRKRGHRGQGVGQRLAEDGDHGRSLGPHSDLVEREREHLRRWRRSSPGPRASGAPPPRSAPPNWRRTAG